MANKEIKYLLRARSRVQACLTRMQTFVQQYDETQDILNIKLRIAKLEEIWNKYIRITVKIGKRR
jgi:hypothetical protein